MELYYEPRNEAMKKITKVDGEPEMTEFESAFLCGLIKENRPKKILEIGVAAGGTTAILMQCISDLELNDTEIFSVDLNKKYYRGDGRDTGFLGVEMEKQMPKVRHEFILGKVIPDVIEQIGGGIDLVVLDTVHSLPGEVLDFPVFLPFLSKNAIVVLHDVAYQHYNERGGFATQTLLDVATGDRIVPMGMDKNRPTKLANIAAIRVNDDTKKYIDAVFYSMTLPWVYIPDKDQLDSYGGFYKKYYSKEMVDIYNTAIELNKKSIIPQPLSLKKRIRRIGRVIIRGY